MKRKLTKKEQAPYLLGKPAELIKSNGKRHITVEFEVDWENYGDVTDELLLDDVFEQLSRGETKGISYKVVEHKETSMTASDVLKWFESVYGKLPKKIRNQLLINISKAV